MEGGPERGLEREHDSRTTHGGRKSSRGRTRWQGQPESKDKGNERRHYGCMIIYYPPTSLTDKYSQCPRFQPLR